MTSPFVRRKIALGFYGFNLSRDGVLKAEDMAQYARQVAEQLRPGEEPARERLRKAFGTLWEVYFKPADADGDGAITFEEYVIGREAFMANPNAMNRAVEVNMEFFEALDFNSDGTIDEREYAAFLLPSGVSGERARAAFKRLDRNGDGSISREEFALNWAEYWTTEEPSAPGNWFYG